MALRVESSAVNGSVQVSEAVRDLLRQTGVDKFYRFTKRRMALKGIGRVTMFSLSRRVATDELSSASTSASV